MILILTDQNRRKKMTTGKQTTKGSEQFLVKDGQISTSSSDSRILIQDLETSFHLNSDLLLHWRDYQRDLKRTISSICSRGHGPMTYICAGLWGALRPCVVLSPSQWFTRFTSPSACPPHKGLHSSLHPQLLTRPSAGTQQGQSRSPARCSSLTCSSPGTYKKLVHKT
jgi:hypothetical protein